MTLLVTAFEKFGPWAHNHTVDIAEALAAELGADALTLPVDLLSAPSLLRARLASSPPSALLSLGLHGRAKAMRVERAALNVADFRIPDNAGRSASGPLIPGAPDGLLTSVDVRALVEEVRAADVPADVSNSAGTYLCNAIFYFGLTEVRRLGIPGLFVHVPPVPGAAVEAAERLAAMRAAGKLPAGPPRHLTGEDGGVDQDVGLPLDQQIRAVFVVARHLLRAAG